MGTISIVEYDRLPVLDGSTLPASPEKKVASNNYTSTTSNAEADAPATGTKLLKVAVIEAHYVEMDAATVASTSEIMPAGTTQWFEVGRLNFRALA